MATVTRYFCLPTIILSNLSITPTLTFIYPRSFHLIVGEAELLKNETSQLSQYREPAPPPRSRCLYFCLEQPTSLERKLNVAISIDVLIEPISRTFWYISWWCAIEVADNTNTGYLWRPFHCARGASCAPDAPPFTHLLRLPAYFLPGIPMRTARKTKEAASSKKVKLIRVSNIRVTLVVSRKPAVTNTKGYEPMATNGRLRDASLSVY